MNDLYEYVLNFFEKNEVECEETIAQSDRIAELHEEFMQKCFELVKSNFISKGDISTKGIKEFAEMLNGREYGSEITKEEEKQAEELGYVVVFGVSDDIADIHGAIHDDVGCFGGWTFAIDKDGIVSGCEEECYYFCQARRKAAKIKACWNNGEYHWSYETDIPHEKFDILEDGEKWCQGIVFDIKDLRRKQ